MQSLDPFHIIAADFSVPFGVRETIQGDCHIYTQALWSRLIGYTGLVLAIGIGFVLMRVALKKGPRDWTRIAILLAGGMFLFSGTIGLVIEHVCRKDYVAVAPDHMVIVNYGKPRVVPYRDIDRIKWTGTPNTRGGCRTILTMVNGERSIENGPVVFAASHHAGEIMVAQGLMK